MQPIREVGEFRAHVRLTMDLIPEVRILVHREGEAAEAASEAEAAPVVETAPRVPDEPPAMLEDQEADEDVSSASEA